MTCKILFVYHQHHRPLLSFVAQDLAILRRFYAVEELNLADCGKRMRHIIASPLLWRSVLRNHMIFGWFGACAPAVMVARLLRRPSILVAGGADAVQMPEIGYGVDLRSRGQRLMIGGFRYASRVLAFSKSSRTSILKLPRINADRVATLYLGIDLERFTPRAPEQSSVLTVGQVSMSNLRRKGLQTFVEAAHHLPTVPFRLAGYPIDNEAVSRLTAAAPANLTYLGGIDDSRLIAAFRTARVYAQLSLHEGFGLALAEAMACGCIPVVTACGALPEVVGNSGLYVPPEDPPAAAAAIRSALFDPELSGYSETARERIATHFPLSARIAGLQQTIQAVLETQ